MLMSSTDSIELKGPGAESYHIKKLPKDFYERVMELELKVSCESFHVERLDYSMKTMSELMELYSVGAFFNHLTALF